MSFCPKTLSKAKRATTPAPRNRSTHNKAVKKCYKKLHSQPKSDPCDGTVPEPTKKAPKKSKPRVKSTTPKAQKKTQPAGNCRTGKCPLKPSKDKAKRKSNKPKAAKPSKPKECGYTMVKFACDHWNKGKRTANHRYPYPKLEPLTNIEVVAGWQEKQGDKITFTMAQGPGFCGATVHGNKHASIQVYMVTPNPKDKRQPNRGKLVKKIDSPEIIFEALSKKSLPPKPGGFVSFLGLIKWYYFPTTEILQYQIMANACGHSKDHNVYGDKICNVKAYPADKYKLHLELAPGYQKKTVKRGGFKDGRSGSATQTEVSKRFGKKKGEFKKETAKVAGKKFDISDTATGISKSQAKTLADGFKFTRDNKEVKAGFPAIKEISEIYQELFGTLNKFQRMLDKFPKVGWYIDYQFMALHGAFDLEWGYKEDPKSWKVYRWVKGETTFTIVQATAEFGFGIKLGTKRCKFIEICAYGAISGKLYIKGTVETQPPPAKLEGSFMLGGELKGEIGIKATAAKNFFKAKANLATALVLEGGIKATQKTPPHVAAKLEWTGIEGAIEFKVAWGVFTYTKKKQLVPKKPLWTYPESNRGITPPAVRPPPRQEPQPPPQEVPPPGGTYDPPEDQRKVPESAGDQG